MRALVVDDEPKMRQVLEFALEGLGHEVTQASNGIEALKVLDNASIGLVLTDLRMPGMDGLALLKAIRERGDEVPVIVLTAYGTVETAVEAMKLGASDYIIRPFEIQAVELAVTRVLAVKAVQAENEYLRSESDKSWHDFVGASASMQNLYRVVRQVAPTRSNVLIIGATGTGKELVARALHRESQRSGLFVPVNCAAIPGDLLESELFGHEKGAFTGAVKNRIGKCELASGGSIFLDEITEMPMPLQAKLLRVLQEGTIERVGGNTTIALDLRVIAAANQDPRRAVEEGRLRQDLYFRLNVFRIDVPALKDRGADIALLAEHFVRKYATELGRSVPRLDHRVIELLELYAWPGNVRELENIMERAVVLCEGNNISVDLLPEDIIDAPPHQPAPLTGGNLPAIQPQGNTTALYERVEELERRLIREALNACDDNKAAAARRLEISERALWYKIKRYGL